MAGSWEAQEPHVPQAGGVVPKANIDLPRVGNGKPFSSLRKHLGSRRSAKNPNGLADFIGRKKSGPTRIKGKPGP